MTIQLVLLIVLIALISSFMHGLLGFGYSMIAMSILPLLISLVDSAAIGTIALAVVCTQISFLLRKYINWKKVFGNCDSDGSIFQDIRIFIWYLLSMVCSHFSAEKKSVPDTGNKGTGSRIGVCRGNPGRNV